METAVQRRLATRKRTKTQLEMAYGEWLTQNRQIAARFEGRLAEKRAAIAELDKAIMSLANEDGQYRRPLVLRCGACTGQTKAESPQMNATCPEARCKDLLRFVCIFSFNNLSLLVCL